MDKDIKALWLERLRDPRSKQAQRALRIGEGMCCLGHLCHIIDPTGWSRRTPDTVGYPDATHEHEEGSSAGMPSDSFLNNCGIRSIVAAELASMNDSDDEEWTLPKISDWIEKNL